MPEYGVVLRRALYVCPVVAALVIACSDAPQAPTGGALRFDAHFDTPAEPADGACLEGSPPNATWTALYADFFGPTGVGACGSASRSNGNGATSSCHHDSGGSGAVSSGFICGDTQESCYQGITSPQASFFGQPVVTPCNPNSSGLVVVLRHGVGGEMPFYPTSVVFSDGDIARIRTWITAGALDN